MSRQVDCWFVLQKRGLAPNDAVILRAFNPPTD